MVKGIYLDYASATPIAPQVKRVILQCLEEPGNPSSVHLAGRKAKKIMAESRKSVARIMNCKTEDMVFTGSGTESDNLAILGTARAYAKYGKHIIASQIEHPAVLRALEYLEKNEGFEISYVRVSKDGLVNPADVSNTIRPDTILISVMYANNEIGTTQPIKKIGQLVKKIRGDKLIPLLHSDACQAAGALDLDVQKLGVDLLTVNGSKIYGPKGVGLLFVRRGTVLTPVILGGGQERGMRAGTENPALVAGFSKAFELADRNKTKENKRLTKIRDYAIEKILKTIPGSRLNGDPKCRLPNNINISFDGVDGEMLVLALDQRGFRVSTGSACAAASTGPSHVLKSIGLSDALARSAIRISLGRQTTTKDLNKLLLILPKVIKNLQRVAFFPTESQKFHRVEKGRKVTDEIISSSSGWQK